MQRRSFLKASGALALGAGFRPSTLAAKIPPHNFDKYDFGGGPPVTDRLYEGPFSADDYPSWQVVMALTASKKLNDDENLTLRQTVGLTRKMRQEYLAGQSDGRKSFQTQ